MESASDNEHERGSTESLRNFRIRFSSEEVAQLARELDEQTIADVHLSLLIYWICEDKEHYEEAKIHIRELCVDQGYITDRIPNQSLRKLLIETRSMRPRYEPDLAYADVAQLSRHSSIATTGAQWPKRTSSLLSSRTWLKTYAPLVLPKVFSDAQRHSAPGYSGTGGLQEYKTPVPVRGVSSRPVQSGSHRLIKISPNSNLIAASPHSSATLSSSFISPLSSRQSPSFTPDRPAPLNMRSRGSNSYATMASIQNVSMSASQLSRSASVPSPNKNDRTTRRLFSLRAESLSNISENTTASDDIFAEEISKYRHHRDSSKAAAVEDDILAMIGRSESAGSRKKYVLMTDEVSDMSSTASSSQSEYQNLDRFQQDEYDPYRYEDVQHSAQGLNGDVFRSRHYDAPASENNRPLHVASTRSSNSASVRQTQYSLPGPRPRPLPIAIHPMADSILAPRDPTASDLYNTEVNIGERITNFSHASYTIEEDASATDIPVHPNGQGCVPRLPYPSSSQQLRQLSSRSEPVPWISQWRAGMQEHREARSLNPAMGSHIHRPVPLRSYESEAYLYPTFHAQARPNLKRSSSASTSPVQEGVLIPLGRTEVETTYTELRDHTAMARAASRASMTLSKTSTLIDGDSGPTMRNPVADAYKSATSVYISQLLQKTRERGAQLPGVSNKTSSVQDSLWNKRNEHLIVAIYGRTDIELSQTDRAFVDKIAKEMRDGIGNMSGYEWFGELFKQV